MQLQDLHAFVTVAEERSFSVAARRLHRTQPAISQAVRRVEEELGDRLFDRSSRNGALTEAGVLLLEHARRLLRMASEAQAAVRELQQVRRGRVLVGANEAAVHSLLPFVRDYAAGHPHVTVEVRRVPSRRIASELLDRSIDFGVMTFQPVEGGLQSIALGDDELVMLAHPKHPLAAKKRVSIGEVGRQVVIAHNDPSPTRDRVLRLYEQRHARINIQISLPSLDGIKRAVEMGVGVAVLPRRCALTEIERGDLVAVKVPELKARRVVRFVFRKTGELSHASAAFLELVRTGRPVTASR
ncbi:MAG TPA: LysR family transcriptional regulator [Vicinamibacterales bacterium]|nr:LysR family transcriptional regulator [Vicinamibacterales bacterium]